MQTADVNRHGLLVCLWMPFCAPRETADRKRCLFKAGQVIASCIQVAEEEKGEDIYTSDFQA